MDTVSMLNKMSFYCQPILPLVYDESMSYYETLCKVVGQLNTTGETVNKLNEGLAGEITDRQAADAELDARIKEIEKTNKKIHFLKVDTVGHLLTENVTREKLSKWVQDGDIISMLYAPDEQENSWAVATNYRCLGARGAETMQLKFYVPISVTNNAGKSGSDVSQEVVVISLPVGTLSNQWEVRSITTTIPATNADGFVNLTAAVSDSGVVTCDVEPGAIVEALRNYFRSTNQFAVAVNARLNYDGKQYHSASAVVKSDASGSGNIRIAFENYYDGVRTENGVAQMNAETIFLVGDVKTNVWSVETIDHKSFDFPRYVGFQFTRGAHNVITTDDESTPNAVYTQYHANESGKFYQNLPVRLIDTVDNAEYWNGVFDIKDGNRMTFTFVTSNYATASDKMLVRVIELSANVNTTTWKYAEKELELPISFGGEKYLVESTAISDGEYDATRKKTKYYLTFNKTNTEIISALNSGKDVQFKVTFTEGNETYPVYFSVGYTRVDVFNNVPVYMFVGSTGDLDHSVITVYGVTDSDVTYRPYLTTTGGILPEPNPDDSDDGKVLSVNKHKWELKNVSKEDFVVNIVFDSTSAPSIIDDGYLAVFDANTDKTFTEISAAIAAGKNVYGAYDGFKWPLSRSSSVSCSFSGLAHLTNLFGAVGTGIAVCSVWQDGCNVTVSAGDLPAPALNGSDNGKSLRINGNKWELQKVGGAEDYIVAITTLSPSAVPTSVDGGIVQFTASCDKTFAEIKGAIDAGKNVLGNYSGNIWPLSLATDTVVAFDGKVNLGYFGDASTATCTFVIQSNGIATITCAAGELPAPSSDGSDNGKVLAVNGTKWVLKALPTYANGNGVSY